MLKNPATKYRPAPAIPIVNRQWPSRTITQAPIWCSIDLRDGNQALARPMDPQRKRRFFELLVRLGLREIEVGFPAASQDDFNFIRSLIESDRIPEEVTIQVLTTAREEHIERSFAALTGVPRAIVHFYLSTSPIQRRVVFGQDEDAVIQRAVRGADRIRQMAAARPEIAWTFQFSPESFSATEPEFALAICEAVTQVWAPTPERRAILNLPATVEVASPNHYADQIEWFASRFSRREAVILSVHPHNDRGCAVAAAELAMLAGADRVEGALFGNGERSGNVDLITLALNLYTQGIDPGLDFGDFGQVAACYQESVGMEISPRHPYAGALIFTAFSGSHQDAIRKGLAARSPDDFWEVPYLPLDPRDVGRDWSGVIRVNSQSGKAGVAQLLEMTTGLILPRRLEIDFARKVQQAMDADGQELTGPEIAVLFHREYVEEVGPVIYEGHHSEEEGAGHQIQLRLKVAGVARIFTGKGNGPIDACVQAMPGDWRLLHYEERAITPGSDAQAAAFVELVESTGCLGVFGVGMDRNIVTASIKAVVAAVNRILGTRG